MSSTTDPRDLIANIRTAQAFLTTDGHTDAADALHAVSAALEATLPTGDDREALADRVLELAKSASMSDLKDGRTDVLLAVVAVLRRPSEPVTVTTVKELDALSELTVILDGAGVAWQRMDGRWVSWLDPGESSEWLVTGRRAPATVLYRPAAVTPEGEKR